MSLCRVLNFPMTLAIMLWLITLRVCHAHLQTNLIENLVGGITSRTMNLDESDADRYSGSFLMILDIIQNFYHMFIFHIQSLFSMIPHFHVWSGWIERENERQIKSELTSCTFGESIQESQHSFKS